MKHKQIANLLAGLSARVLARFMACVLAVAFAVLLPLSSLAQESDADALAEAIRKAADSGVGVIVVDSTGRPLEAAEPQDEAPVEKEGESSAMMMAQSEVKAFREALNQRLEALPNALREVAYILRATSPDGTIMAYAKVLGWSVLFLAIGRWVTTEIYGKRLVRRFVVARIKEKPEGYAEKMPFLVVRFFAGMGGTLFGMLFAFLVTMVIFGPSGDTSIELTALAIYTAYFLGRTASDLWRMVLSPFLSQYRIPVFSDRAAKRMFYWASGLAVFDICAVLFSTWVMDFGLNNLVSAMVYGCLMLASTLLNVLGVLINGRFISNAIRGGMDKSDCPLFLRIFSLAWAPLMVAYLVFGWLELAFDLVLDRPVSLPPTAGLYMVMMCVFVVYGVINYLIEVYFARRAVPQVEVLDTLEDGDVAEGDVMASDRPAHPIATFKALAQRAASILGFLAGAIALIFVWNPDFEVAPNSVMDRALDVIAVLFIGYIVFHMARIWIDSKIAEEEQDEEEGELGDEGGGASASRLATLLPLFRGAILAVVIVTIILIVLMEIGINVSPLFAGAGVVGLAVGFGSQTLVRDIFSGAFFLLDDAFRRGEYIDIGNVKGTVEKISVRSFQLRHHLGALHTIPFGEIQVLTNYSRDWVIMKLPLRVTYDTDVEKVRKLIKKLGQELLTDEVIGHNFIQPLKSQGVIEMQDSAMIIRVKFMTKPGDQWLVRKKVFQEIRDLFEREGIKFAHREVTVRVVDSTEKGMTPAQRDAAMGAAQPAIEDEFMEANEGGD
ncbi:putative MscS family protein YkuT [Tritonibacter multivorans]|uniref:Putative MscS family protein YkuT n=1 Tax=Tritonibacter multivorans TaxID=928856 RepID=A0A0P1G2D8_9RHOB|nr:mechanosensitive ion channel domain-containing protein [Tritonibacter multivorans]MDA7419616.1 mechanosensitive ion channel [Tritonibacter multivorans]CUH75832.1 putative MscS family protein YkuT [Tritonibacter multivorans]SFC60278.1 Small-conductance mechanosensitive channel [Tritonibacter multivorans]